MNYGQEYRSDAESGVSDGQEFVTLTPMSVHDGYADCEGMRPIVFVRFRELPNHGLMFGSREQAEVFVAGILELVDQRFPKERTVSGN